MNEALRRRTEQKLRYAQLHLRELATMPAGRGHDFERAHQEAVLAQLMGAYDAFLVELNDVLRCGRGSTDVSLGKLRDSLRSQRRSSTVLARLHDLREDPESWLRQLLDLRHASTHVAGIPLAFNANDGKAAFRHPATLQDFPDDSTATLSQWLERMGSLTNELREIAAVETAG